MAGRPRHRAMVAKMVGAIEERGGEDWFFGAIIDGRNVTDLAKEMEIATSCVYDWVNKEKLGGGEERRALLREARKLSAHTLADQAEGEARLATPVDVSVRKLRADILWRKAQVYNRAELGPQVPQNATVTLNIQDLHLAALMAPLPESLSVERATPLLVAGDDGE